MTLRVAGGRGAAGAGIAGAGLAAAAGVVLGLGLAFFATLRRAGALAAGRRAAVLFFELFFAAPRFALRFFELFFAAPLRDFDERFFVDFLLELFFAFFEDLRFDAAMSCLLLQVWVWGTNRTLIGITLLARCGAAHVARKQSRRTCLDCHA